MQRTCERDLILKVKEHVKMDSKGSHTHTQRVCTNPRRRRSASSVCRYRSSECSLRAQRSQARPRPSSDEMWRRE